MNSPPWSPEAEAAVIGGILLDPRTLDEAADVVSPADFYRADHRLIFAALLAMQDERRPLDLVTTSEWLEARGQLADAGGMAYLATMARDTPSAANVRPYAQLVREHSIRRRLIAASTDIARLANEEPDMPAALDQAQALLSGIAERGDPGGAVMLREAMSAWCDGLDTRYERGGELAGEPTGLADLDRALNGLQPGRLYIIAGRPGMGKALALDTPLPTPTGWTTMGEVSVGDSVMGADGLPTRVIAATEVMTGRLCYEVEFSDGSVLVADAEHQWTTQTRKARRNGYYGPWDGASVVTTQQIAATLLCGDKMRRFNHSVPIASPFALPDADLPIPPYTLGAWLGDGHSYSGGMSSADPEVMSNIQQDGYRVTKHAGKYAWGVLGLRVQLRKSGLLQNKHIPAVYLRASERQRRELLAGLLDTDGCVENNGKSVGLETTSRALADGAYELIVSLGYRCVVRARRVLGKTEESSTCYRLRFTTHDSVFRLVRKGVTHAAIRQRTNRSLSRYIVDVRPIVSVPVRCIEVGNADHLYLAGRSCIPTHNSVLGLQIAAEFAMRRRHALVHTLEMPTSECIGRLFASLGGIDHGRLQSAKLEDDDWPRVTSVVSQLLDVPLAFDECASLSIGELRARARRHKRIRGLDILTVDHLGLLRGEGRSENRVQEVGAISRGLKRLAKELDIPVVALCQLNRGCEQRPDKRPRLGDLRDTGDIEQDADAVVFIYRDEVYHPDTCDVGCAELILGKSRGGMLTTIPVQWDGRYQRMRNLVDGLPSRNDPPPAEFKPRTKIRDQWSC